MEEKISRRFVKYLYIIGNIIERLFQNSAIVRFSYLKNDWRLHDCGCTSVPICCTLTKRVSKPKRIFLFRRFAVPIIATCLELLLTEDEEPCFEQDYRKSKIMIFGWIYLHSSGKWREGQRERVGGKTGSC